MSLSKEEVTGRLNSSRMTITNGSVSGLGRLFGAW